MGDVARLFEDPAVEVSAYLRRLTNDAAFRADELDVKTGKIAPPAMIKEALKRLAKAGSGLRGAHFDFVLIDELEDL